MIKKAKVFRAKFLHSRGSVLAVASFIVAVAGLAAIVGLSSMMAKIINSPDKGLQAYFAALNCVKQFDSLQPITANLNASCVKGADIDFTTSTNSAIACTGAGQTNAVVSVGDCTCAAQITDSSVSGLSIVSNGICGSRPDNTDKFVVSIAKTINLCPTKTQFCGAGSNVIAGGSCRDACLVDHPTCCISGTCTAGLCN